jgi:peptidase M23-like protein
MRSITLAAAAVAAFFLAPPAAAASSWTWPVAGRVITPYSNGADPYAGGQHRGIDVAAPVGTRVVAATGGTVSFAGLAGSSGLTVAVRTDDGRFDTSYLHLSSLHVRQGERVAIGEDLGAVGTTGRRSAEEPHLHFGVRDAGSRFAYRDPLDFLPALPPSEPAPEPTPGPVAVPMPTKAAAIAAPVEAFAHALAAHPATAPQPHPLATHPAPAPQAHPLATHPAATAQPHRPATHPVTAPAPHPPATHPTAAHRTHPVIAISSAAKALQHAPREVRYAASTHTRRSPAPRPHVPAPLPAAGPTTRRAPDRPHPRRASATHANRPAPHTSRHPLDLGWLAACIAMVAAATLLGRPRQTTRSVRRAFALTPAVSRPGREGSRQ